MTTIMRIAILGALAVLVTCTGPGPRAPEDPGAIRPEDIEQEMLDAVKNIARGESPQELVDRSLDILDRQSDSETRAVRLVDEALKIVRALLSGEESRETLEPKLARLVEIAARRYHLDEADFAAARERLARISQGEKAAMEARADSAASQHLANEARLHALLTSLLAAVRSEDSSSVESISQDIATWLTPSPVQESPRVTASQEAHAEINWTNRGESAGPHDERVRGFEKAQATCDFRRWVHHWYGADANAISLCALPWTAARPASRP
jgi:hypothetical protein